jgi:hypothetical protein
LAKRELVAKWDNVSFHNFPLRLWKETLNGYIYVMDGISLSNNNTNAIWGGRFRFHTPKMNPDEICKHIWDVRKMKEWVCVDEKEKEREYFCLENPHSSSSAVAKHFMLFTSNKYEKVAGTVELLAKVFCVKSDNEKISLKLIITAF